MATDNWINDGEDNWDTPGDWSGGLPGATSNVVINEGAPQVTSSFGTVASITSSSVLTFIDAGLSSVTGDVLNSGFLELDTSGDDGGSSLSIGGALVNDGFLTIGPSSGALSADSTVEAKSVTNFVGTEYGVISLYGSSTAEATLDVASAAGFGAAGAENGFLFLSGDSEVEFARGQITTIALGAELSLTGPDAFIADASSTSSNSALTGLSTLMGGLDLYNGATVTTSGALTNTSDGEILLGTDDGHTSLTIGGNLTNDGEIELNGAATNHATLSVKGTFTNDSYVIVDDDFEKLANAVRGTGSFFLENGSTLQFGGPVSSGQVIGFDGTADTLTLSSASSFKGTIEDFFAASETVDATTFAKSDTTFLFTKTSADSCTWTLTDGASTAVLHFAGEPYVKRDFSIVSANGGAGSALKFV